jgi:hypothetical protein
LEAEAAESAMREPISTSQAIGDFVRSDNFRLLIGSIIIILGLIIMVGFFVFNTVETTIEANLSFLEEVESFDILPIPKTCTAFDIWRGERSCQKSFAFNTEVAARSGKTGFIAVRNVDRFLIAMPIGALVLIVLAWFYITETFDALVVLMAIAGVAIGLLLFPMVWQSVSDGTGTNADLARDRLVDSMDGLVVLNYSATEHYALTGLVLGVCIVALAIMMVELAGILGVPRNLLTAKGEVEPDLLKVFAERKRLGR